MADRQTSTLCDEFHVVVIVLFCYLLTGFFLHNIFNAKQKQNNTKQGIRYVNLQKNKVRL